MTGIVLASASRARLAMLERAGVSCIAMPAAVDETEISRGLAAEGAGPAEIAEALAEIKAQRISPKADGAMVIGADQVLDCEDTLFGKAADRAAARAHLQALSGKTHRLTSAVVCVRDGTRLWHQTDSARLSMRTLSPAFIDDYLDRMGDRVLHSVGGYEIEGLGAQLFTRIQGDVFTIMGMPLLPLLGFLRVHGLVPA